MKLRTNATRWTVIASLAWMLTPCVLAVAEDAETPSKKPPLAEVATPYPAIPEAVTSFGAAVLDDVLYVYGGHKGTAHHYYKKAQANTLWALDLKLNRGAKAPRWRDLGQGPRLQGLAMVGHNGRLYRLGGFAAKNIEAEKQDLWSQAGAAAYDVKAKTWSDLAPLPEPRSSFDAAVLGDVIYVVGGWQMRGADESIWHKTAYAMDLTKSPRQWVELPKPPFQRRALAVAAHQGKIYAMGGMLPQGETTTDVHIYDPAKRSWSEGPKLPGKTMEGFGASAFAVDGALYVSTYGGNLNRLSPEGDSWKRVSRLERARFFHRMLPFQGRLLSVGGASMEIGKFDELDLITVPVRKK